MTHRTRRSTTGAIAIVLLSLFLLAGGFIAWDRSDYDIPEWIEYRGDPWTSSSLDPGRPNRTATAIVCRIIYNVSQELAIRKIQRRGR